MHVPENTQTTVTAMAIPYSNSDSWQLEQCQGIHNITAAWSRRRTKNIYIVFQKALPMTFAV